MKAAPADRGTRPQPSTPRGRVRCRWNQFFALSVRISGTPPSAHYQGGSAPAGMAESRAEGGSGLALTAPTPLGSRRTGANTGNAGKSLVEGRTTLGIRYASESADRVGRFSCNVLPNHLNRLFWSLEVQRTACPRRASSTMAQELFNEPLSLTVTPSA